MVGVTARSKVAVTRRVWVIDTTHASVPLHAPLQPAKVEPSAGDGVSVTLVPVRYDSLQSTPQVMPAGALVTVPAPIPALLTVSAKVCSVNVAVTVCSPLMVA